jgi:NRE family putative nickel resistance protein-like MFS transporter
MSGALAVFASLKNPVFARLYAAQTASLLGDALIWVALALLAFELAGLQAALVLGVALTLRVTAFVVFSPLAGALADRLSRKTIMVTANLARVGVLSLLPLVTETWQVYVLMFALNTFTAFFTPTFQATIPLVTGKRDYPQAIALSGATFEMLGVLGPGIAGALAVVMGGRSLFWLSAAALLASAVLILTVRAKLKVARNGPAVTTWSDVKEGTSRLWRDGPIRYGLLLELVASVAGAWVLVNTVVHVKGNLALGDLHFGWVMAVFGLGATIAALAVGALDRRWPRTTFIFFGALVTSLAILPANLANFAPLLALWFVAGAGQNWVNLPVQTLIADRIPEAVQGRVYGAHFAWSHLWWAGAYPLAGWLGSALPTTSFWYGGVIGLALLAVIQLVFAPRRAASGARAGEG